ncbi:MAG: hypothetical protein ACYS8Z_03725 [Planctomycetota bacterium]
MKSELYVYCKFLGIIAFFATVLVGIYATEQGAHPGPAGLCIASALVLGMSLIAMAILQSSDKS